MRFLEPWMLVALGGVAIPLLIHLYHRRKAVRKPFPAIHLIKQSQKRLAPSLRMKRLLLLLSRMALLILIPLALAKPLWTSEEEEARPSRLPHAVLYLYDDTMASRAFESPFKALERDLEERNANDRFAVIAISQPQGKRRVDWTDQKAELLSEVKDWKPLPLAGDLPKAIDEARDLFFDTQEPIKTLVILSPMTQSLKPDEELKIQERLQNTAGVQWIQLKPQTPLSHWALIDVLPRPSGESQHWIIDVQIQYYGVARAAHKVQVTVLEGEQVLGKTSVTVDEKGHGEGALDLQCRHLCTSPLQVMITPPEEDKIQDDHSRWILLNVQRKRQVLLIDGDPHSLSIQDEVFFIQKAIKPSADSSSSILSRVISNEFFKAQDLVGIDVAVLANVGMLSEAQSQALLNFVREGGGVWITLGNQIHPREISGTYAKLFAKPLRSIKVLARMDDPDAPLKITHLQFLDLNHPIFKPFEKEGVQLLRRPRIYTYGLLEPSISEQTYVLASYANGAPALILKHLGQGNLLLWTSSIDRDWTDLPLDKVYLPWIRQIIDVLGKGHSEKREAVVGQYYAIAVHSELQQLEVVDSQGHVVRTWPREALNHRPFVSFMPQSKGIYRVYGKDVSARLEQLFISNLSPKASDLRPWSIKEKASQPSSKVEMQVEPKGRPLWPLFLLLALFVLYLETLLGLRQKTWGLLRHFRRIYKLGFYASKKV